MQLKNLQHLCEKRCEIWKMIQFLFWNIIKVTRSFRMVLSGGELITTNNVLWRCIIISVTASGDIFPSSLTYYLKRDGKISFFMTNLLLLVILLDLIDIDLLLSWMPESRYLMFPKFYNIFFEAKRNIFTCKCVCFLR